MRPLSLLSLLLISACYSPRFVPGQVECGPGGACPEGLVCRADNRCWETRADDGDLGLPADTDLRPGAGDMRATISPGFLHTENGTIVDSSGRVVRLTGLNWFGLETDVFAPHGLWARPMGAMLDQIKGLGYNFLRVPFSSQLLDPGSAPKQDDLQQSPELVGLSGAQVLDRLIVEAGKRNLRIILDRHQPAANQPSALWYTPRYPEERWISDWKALAARYKGNPTVIGFDLHNEPHAPATWGDGGVMNDWRLAAERAGAAILQQNPDLLIIVQGIDQAEGQSYWWGGNLKSAKSKPVRLPIAGRLVYEAHDYPKAIADQDWFNDPRFPDNMPALWDSVWGYLVKDPDATKNTPVLLGEFGTRNMTDVDRKWFQKLVGYLRDNQLSFSYWCWNPNTDLGGILKDDWVGVNADKQGALQPLLAPPLP